PSCTSALEMATLLADIQPGDEVIMPSYTFPSTATALVLRGATPVFIDIDPKTLNINPDLIASAVTNKTKAIIPVDYAGVGCEIDKIIEIAGQYNLKIIEDAAQAIFSKYKGQPVGAKASLAAISFHDTKNIVCGEGGALIVNAPEMVHRAEILRDKGTNRSQFLRGEVDKYTWVDLGSSFLLGEISAAFLLAQLEAAENITQLRMSIWSRYHHQLRELENNGFITRPFVPDTCEHNAHMYYVIVKNEETRNKIIQHMNSNGISVTSHYEPLHSSRAGKKYGRAGSDLSKTLNLAGRILRLPLYPDLTIEQQDYVIKCLYNYFDYRLNAAHV
ncbi:MAG: dTDP-4-amino-4,6-dideoxygalactose transaminase, partial [Bdellovibrionales bacterium]|nr:dTDP-4-amino-4,6-dideoxygalactose transaminase [Bdellovibrionales bacterium]